MTGGQDKILSLHTCVLFTAVRTESGNVFWWGILPFQQRKKLIEKYTNKKKSLSGSTPAATTVCKTASILRYDLSMTQELHLEFLDRLPVSEKCQLSYG